MCKPPPHPPSPGQRGCGSSLLLFQAGIELLVLLILLCAIRCVCRWTLSVWNGGQTLHARQTLCQQRHFSQPWAVVSSEARRGGHMSVGVGLSTGSLRVERTARWLPPHPHPSASRLMGSHLSLTYLPVTPVAHPRTIKGLFVCKHLASSTGAIHHACGRREADRGGGRGARDPGSSSARTRLSGNCRNRLGMP